MKTHLWKKRFRLFVWYKFWKHNLKPGLCFLFMHRSGAEKDGSAGAISSIILSAPLTIRLVLPAVASSLCSEISSRGAAHLRARPVQFVSQPRALSEQKFYCAYTHSRHSRAHIILFFSMRYKIALYLKKCVDISAPAPCNFFRSCAPCQNKNSTAPTRISDIPVRTLYCFSVCDTRKRYI